MLYIETGHPPHRDIIALPYGIAANQIQWRLGAPGDPAASYIPPLYGEASALACNKSIVKPGNPDLNVNCIHKENQMKCLPHIT